MKIKKTSTHSFGGYTYTINSKDLISPINVDCQIQFSVSQDIDFDKIREGTPQGQRYINLIYSSKPKIILEDLPKIDA